MTILVTGGTGLVGRAICGGLAAGGHRVRCVDRVLRPLPGVEGGVADLRVREAIYPYLEGVEAVVHLANHAHHRSSDAQTLVTENTAMNTNVFQAAVEAGARALVFSSSVQVVSGRPLDGAAHREPRAAVYPISGDSPARPGNAYAASKAMGEQLLRYHAEVHGVAATTLRLPYIVRGHRGLEWQAANMAVDNWPHEGFAWLWAGDLAGLMERILTDPEPGYRCFLPSAPPMDGYSVVRAALARHTDARVAPIDHAAFDGWRPTPLEEILEDVPSLA